MKNYHEPVMVREVLENLHINSQAGLRKAKVIDATLGSGGHTLFLLERGINVLGIDWDPELFEVAKKRILNYCGKKTLRLFLSYFLHGN